MVVAPLVTSRILYSGWSLARHHRAQAVPDASQAACRPAKDQDLALSAKKTEDVWKSGVESSSSSGALDEDKTAPRLGSQRFVPCGTDFHGDVEPNHINSVPHPGVAHAN